MKDDNKTKMQLISELTELRAQNAALEKSITGHISAELVAEESSRYAESIVETVRESLLVLNAEMKIISANRNFYRIFNVTPGETIGSFIYDLGNKQWDIPKLRELLEETLPKEEAFDDLEVTRNFQDIGYKIMLLNARQVYRQDIGAKLILLAIEDITERKQVEEELQQEQLFSKSIINSLPNIFFLYNYPECKLVGWNKRHETELGYTADELKDRHVMDFHAPENNELIMTAIKTVMEIGHGSVEDVLVTKDGRQIPYLSYAVRFESKGKSYLLGICEDITERKQVETRLMGAMADLERSNKDLEQFAYVASHDLQEPLRMVSSYTQLLAKHYDGRLDEKAKKFMDYAVDGAVRMQILINDLLTYSRIGTRGTPLETTDTHALLGEAIRNLAAMIEEKRAIITNDNLPTVRADASQLMQVFQNLISNAIKFQGEKVPRIHVSAQEKVSEWVFSIRDNGIGIDRQYGDRVFVIFQRLHTRQDYPGTGIGLALCKRIVERHGGRIWFESKPGMGSKFFFSITKSAKEV